MSDIEAQEQQNVSELLGKRSVPKDMITEEGVKQLETGIEVDETNAVVVASEQGANNNNDDDDDGVEVDENDFNKSDVDQLWVCLRGVERFDQERNVLKMLQRTFEGDNFAFTKISKPKKKNMAFIQLSTIEERNRFIACLKARKPSKKQKKLKPMPAFKGDRNLSSGVAVATLDTQNSAAHQQQQRDSRPAKVASKEDIEAELQTPLEERVCPLWKTPYEDQIALKRKDYEEIIRNLQTRARKDIRFDEQTPSWVTKDPKIDQFLECDSEFRFNYRNKTELTIGLNHLGEPKVGYNRTNFEKGFAFIDDASKNAVASKESIVLAYALEAYIRESGLAVYDRFVHQGFWRYFVIRQSFKTKQILLNIVVKTSTIQSMEGKLDEIKAGLLNVFSAERLPADFGYEIVSLGLQPYELPSDSIPQDGKIEIIQGKHTYQENILGKTFNISANAFLQVHTPQCERLYKLIGSLAGELDEKTIFLDICSGIGTIGICLATSAKEVIGIEMVETACEDAKVNVEENKVENYKVICSKVEDVINGIVAPLAGLYKIIGVVDPPRPGLHGNVVKALRTCRGLDHLIYVACNPVAVSDNLLALCMPESKRRRAPGFHITKYFGCDLFPQTKHFEAVFYLERYPKDISEPIEAEKSVITSIPTPSETSE